MNAERLLAHYERIADAPDAIARLRRFILDLAVRGKLVPQDRQDEPASELLKRIAKEKARQVKAGEIRDKPSLAAVADDEKPFEVPKAWRWVRFANIVDFSAGRTPSRNDSSFWNSGDHAWISIADMDDGQVLMATKETVSDRARDRVFGLEPEPPGTIIMSFKLTIGKIARLGIPAFHNEAIITIKPHLADLDAYLFKALPQFARQGDTKGAIKGATLNRGSISNILFPLPPLAEQHRIVAKVDDLMALCNRLEAARGEREARRDRLAAASLARLNAPDPATFQDDTRFALDTLQALTTRPDQIKHLRQTILNLAVRGYLSTGGTWRSSPIKLGDVATLQNGYAFRSEWFAKSGTRLLRNANVGHGTLNWDEEVRLPESRIEEFERFRLTEGDVVLSLDRPFIVTGTKVARVKAKDLPALLLQRVGRFILSQALNPDYVFLWINSPHFSEQIDPGRSNGVPHISSKQVEAAVLFLLP
jgi:restriction endonuclease S subunit